MAVEVKLPRLGQGMEAGTIVRWLKSEGDTVAKGEPLYELDTDKVTQEVEADSGGVLLKIVVRDGEVDVGTTIAVIGSQGEDVSEILAGAGDGGPPAPRPAAPSPPARDESVEVAPPPEPEPSTPPETSTPTPERVKASPLARRIAREEGVDLATLTGTGP